MHTPPTAHHQWLKRLVGEWDVLTEASMGPGQPPMKYRGHESARMLGDLWLIAEMVAEVPCPPTPENPTAPAGSMTMRAIMTVGYDPGKAKYVGSWVGSPMATLFVYEGELEAAPTGGASHIVPLNTTGPSFLDQTKTVRYQDIIEFHPAPGTDSKDPTPHAGDRRVLRSQVQTDDGTWLPFMRAEYTRPR